MLLSWYFTYVLFVATIVLGCVVAWQHATIHDGRASLHQFESQLGAQRKLNKETLARSSRAEQEAQSHVDELRRVRSAREAKDDTIADLRGKLAGLDTRMDLLAADNRRIALELEAEKAARGAAERRLKLTETDLAAERQRSAALRLERQAAPEAPYAASGLEEPAGTAPREAAAPESPASEFRARQPPAAAAAATDTPQPVRKPLPAEVGSVPATGAAESATGGASADQTAAAPAVATDLPLPVRKPAPAEAGSVLATGSIPTAEPPGAAAGAREQDAATGQAAKTKPARQSRARPRAKKQADDFFSLF